MKKIKSSIKKYWYFWLLGAILVVIAYKKRNKISSSFLKAQGKLEPGAEMNVSKILKQGSKGAEVAELQRKMNADGAEPALSIDGIFGPKTEAALVAIKGIKEVTLEEYDQTVNASTVQINEEATQFQMMSN